MPDLKPELGKKNPYWIGKHRYLELKHFCLQYPEWKKAYVSLEFKMGVSCDGSNERGRDKTPGDPTGKIAMLRAELSRNMEMVERTALATDDVLGQYLFKAVTEERSFNWLKSVMEIPCERGMYYDRYRKFYWLLSQEKGL